MEWLRKASALCISLWMFLAGVWMLLAIGEWLVQIPNRTARCLIAISFVAIWPWMLAEWPTFHRSRADASIRWATMAAISAVAVSIGFVIGENAFRNSVIGCLAIGWILSVVLRAEAR